MNATKRDNLIKCPICGHKIRHHKTRAVMLAHTTPTGDKCPMSGQPIGASSE